MLILSCMVPSTGVGLLTLAYLIIVPIKLFATQTYTCYMSIRLLSLISPLLSKHWHLKPILLRPPTAMLRLITFRINVIYLHTILLLTPLALLHHMPRAMLSICHSLMLVVPSILPIATHGRSFHVFILTLPSTTHITIVSVTMLLDLLIVNTTTHCKLLLLTWAFRISDLKHIGMFFSLPLSNTSVSIHLLWLTRIYIQRVVLRLRLWWNQTASHMRGRGIFRKRRG